MRYTNITKGIFISRPNRFIAKVLVDGDAHIVHVKNTGRCKEFLVNGATVYLTKCDNSARKTKYDVIAVEKMTSDGVLLINFDSQIANDVAFEFLKNGNMFSADAVIKREVRYGDFRFDFFISDGNRKVFLEVKGVTFEENGVAMFPDAPTTRGIKHIDELVKCIDDGYGGILLFIIQMKRVYKLIPNDFTHKAFGDALRNSVNKGVKVIAMDCVVEPDSIVADMPVNVEL